jgi:hypothetical protein
MLLALCASDDIMSVKTIAEAMPLEVVVATQERGRAADPWVVAKELLGEWGD